MAYERKHYEESAGCYQIKSESELDVDLMKTCPSWYYFNQETNDRKDRQDLINKEVYQKTQNPWT